MMKKLFYAFTTLLLLIGNFAMAQTFVVCDTECRSFPLGDCTTEHTDTDNIEWPCEIILDAPSIAANQTAPDDLELLPNVDSLDARPQIVGIPNHTSRVVMTFSDQVFTTQSGYKILREWTVIDWITGVVANYNQIIKNNYGILQDCAILTCQANLTVQLPTGSTMPVDIWVSDVLAGDYSHCDLSTYPLEITDTNGNVTSGTGMVSTTEAGTYTTLVTEPTSGNTCWGNLTIVESTTNGSCTLACNNGIMVSLAATPAGPSATLVTDVFLEGGYPNCDITTFEITATDAAGNAITGIGSITVTEEGTYTYSITNPADGIQCWGTMIVENRLMPCNDPFDETNIQWPNDVTIDNAAITAQQVSPDDLEILVGVADARPATINEGCNLIGYSFDDVVIDLGLDGFKIIRTWTLINWMDSKVYEHIQVIKNTSGSWSNCTVIVCNDQIMVALGPTSSGPSATLESNVFLEGAYPNCDINAFEITTTDAAGNTSTGIGSITITTEGTYNYTITDPTSGNQCWGTLIAEYSSGDPCNDPFEICDTECRSTPIGDCASGHTDTDNIEWPCDITLDDAAISAQDLSPSDLENLVDPMDAHPTLVNEGCNLVGSTYSDQVITSGTNGYKIIRTWTLIHWNSGTVYEYIQVIKNQSGSLTDCSIMVCYNGLVIELPEGNMTSVEIWASDILAQDYSHCNLSNFTISLTNADGDVYVGVEMVTTSETGIYTAAITEPSGNTCWSTLTVVQSTATGGNCTLVCNNQVMVALAPTASGPSATLHPNVFLEGAYPNCDINSFEITTVDVDGVTTTGVGNITVTAEGTYTYTITDPTSGNQCWGTMIAEYRGGDPCNDPFEICDTECRSTPIGDCASGHTDTDNVEWPCDITLDDATISDKDVSPTDLESLVDLMDARPTLVNEGCNLIGTTFADQVFNLGPDGFKILRTWTLLNWSTGNIYEYNQVIKNTAGLISDCSTLVCNNMIYSSLAQTPGGLTATLDSDVFLEGGYPNCDLSTLEIVLTDAIGNIITGIGAVTVTEENTHTYTISDPVSGNACWGTLVVENKNPTNCPFEICDTECRTAPLGDCASGHTDTDNVEWPCDITINIPGLTAQNMAPHDLLSVTGVDERDAEPVLVNYDANCNIIALNWHDTVIDDGSNGFKIVRVWTIINWETTELYEYSQIIKNLSPGLQSLCKPLECQEVTVVGLGAPGSELTIKASELLAAEYPDCDLEELGIRVTDTDYNMIANGIGEVVLNQTGEMNYSVAELETNNFCRGKITIEPAPSSSSTKEARALEAIKVYPNPATDVLLFDYKKLDLRGDVTISVLDQSGRQLLQEINNNRLNISTLNNGLYIYQIRLNDEIRYGKFTVLK